MAVPNSVLGSATHGFAVVPDDQADLAQLPRALYVGTGGTVVAVLEGGSELTFKNVASGQTLDIRAKRVKATGTTAGDIVALL